MIKKKDIPLSKNAEGVYKIGGASFNDEELYTVTGFIRIYSERSRKSFASLLFVCGHGML